VAGSADRRFSFEAGLKATAVSHAFQLQGGSRVGEVLNSPRLVHGLKVSPRDGRVFQLVKKLKHFLPAHVPAIVLAVLDQRGPVGVVPAFFHRYPHGQAVGTGEGL